MRVITFLTFLSIAVSPLVAWGGHGDEAHIEILPSSIVYETGEEIIAEIMLNTAEAATSLRIQFLYDIHSLRVKEIQPNTDDFPFWWKQEGDNGLVELELSAPMPGFQGEASVAIVTFEAINSGSYEFMLGEDSLVLNGQDENILLPKEERQAAAPVENAAENSIDQPAASGNSSLGIMIAALAAVVIGGGTLAVWQRKNKQAI
jgi:hypothetical protein